MKYVFESYACSSCGASVYSEDKTWSRGKYGPSLRAYIVYQLLELHLSLTSIGKHLSRLFGFGLNPCVIKWQKDRASEFYGATFKQIVQRIKKGSLVHADETTVNLKGRREYVWVFTNLEEVAYFYSGTREGEVAREFLREFSGVLVSDFYAVYDSIDCAQQKCLIHLMRDLNDDLVSEPFNSELKEVVSEFARLLRLIVDSVDRHGLKKHFLQRHIKDVNAFYQALGSRVYDTELAGKAKHRLEKNRDKLFTFLEHDGVPWNNNNAEHAIKAFAALREDLRASSNSQGIREYLVLLSVCETCRYKGVDFLDFLESGELDIEEYAKRHRHRGKGRRA